MTPQELTDWEILEHLDPWGERRQDHRFAMMTTSVVNALGSKNPRTRRPWNTDDFLLDFKEIVAKAQEPKAMERALLAWAKAHNAKLEEAKRPVRPTGGRRR
jgi:hypothetical protein